ncbi:MAG: methylenetetrahydrofolate reductase [Thermoguttaceae bacterium]
MSNPTTRLEDRIASGKLLLVAEITPPAGADPAALRQAARRYADKVHAVGITDNRDRVSMSALAAAAIVAGEGIEPILHVTTRDRNRIALVSEALGAQALGIRNLLCTSGSHQTLGQFRAAKNVYDVDSIQLLAAYAGLARDASLVGQQAVEGAGPFCLGAVASPDADPVELQVLRLEKKVAAGATFLITQPVYDLERFDAWWKEVARRGIHEKVAILAGIQPLTAEVLARHREDKRPSSRIPEAVAERIESATSPGAKRVAAIEAAVETVRKLAGLAGLRGFGVSGDGDATAALEIIEKSGLETR